MIIGILLLDLHVPNAHSLKDRRSVLTSLKGQLRNRFNIAVAEVDTTEKWQRATLGISTLGDHRDHVDGVLDRVTDWLRTSPAIALIRAERDYR